MSGVMRNWLQSVPIERDGVSWAVSLCVHLTLLVLSLSPGSTSPERIRAPCSPRSTPGRPPPICRRCSTAKSTGANEEVGSNGLQGTSMALATAPNLADVSRIETGQMEASDIGDADMPVIAELSSAPISANGWPWPAMPAWA